MRESHCNMSTFPPFNFSTLCSLALGSCCMLRLKTSENSSSATLSLVRFHNTRTIIATSGPIRSTESRSFRRCRCCCFRRVRSPCVCPQHVSPCSSVLHTILWASGCAMTPTPGGPTPGRLTPGVSATPEPSMTKNSSSSRASQLRLALNSGTTRRSAKNAQNAIKSPSTPLLQDHRNVQPCR